MIDLPQPEILHCFFAEGFTPRMGVMRLSWPDNADSTTMWSLPEGVVFHGPAPDVLGIGIDRRTRDEYTVSLVWNQICLHWPALCRAQILASVLQPLLAAIGTDLHLLLDQPIRSTGRTLARAA